MCCYAWSLLLKDFSPEIIKLTAQADGLQHIKTVHMTHLCDNYHSFQWILKICFEIKFKNCVSRISEASPQNCIISWSTHGRHLGEIIINSAFYSHWTVNTEWDQFPFPLLCPPKHPNQGTCIPKFGIFISKWVRFSTQHIFFSILDITQLSAQVTNIKSTCASNSFHLNKHHTNTKGKRILKIWSKSEKLDHFNNEPLYLSQENIWQPSNFPVMYDTKIPKNKHSRISFGYLTSMTDDLVVNSHYLLFFSSKRTSILFKVLWVGVWIVLLKEMKPSRVLLCEYRLSEGNQDHCLSVTHLPMNTRPSAGQGALCKVLLGMGVLRTLSGAFWISAPHLAIMGVEVNPPMVAGWKDENLDPKWMSLNFWINQL